MPFAFLHSFGVHSFYLLQLSFWKCVCAALIKVIIVLTTNKHTIDISFVCLSHSYFVTLTHYGSPTTIPLSFLLLTSLHFLIPYISNQLYSIMSFLLRFSIVTLTILFVKMQWKRYRQLFNGRRYKHTVLLYTHIKWFIQWKSYNKES